mgnify:CR=1 FL=1
MNTDVEESIVALATPEGTSAIAVIRVSGSLCPSLVSKVFGKNDTKVLTKQERRMQLGDYCSIEGGIIDQVLYVLFCGPRSYTGEDMLEIHTHGNPFLIQKILDDLLQRGCKMAEPGAFSKRAFDSGKLDLTQAEAVAEIIGARSERALEAAQRRLKGELGQAIIRQLEALVDVQAQLEAYIDFPEEDLPAEEHNGPMKALLDAKAHLHALYQQGRYSHLLDQGIHVVLAGAPNAGKSSLLNALLGKHRVLVSEEPGTTRDFIREPLRLGPHTIQLMDTAGLRDAEDPLEQQGTEMTERNLREADFILLVVDASQPPPSLNDSLLPLFHVEQSLLVLNKSDLSSTKMAEFMPELARVSVSAKQGEGLESLKETWVQKLDALTGFDGDEERGLQISARQSEALKRALEHLDAVESHWRSQSALELLASDLRETVNALGEIVGRVDNEQMLDQLFAQFCIGK